LPASVREPDVTMNQIREEIKGNYGQLKELVSGLVSNGLLEDRSGRYHPAVTVEP